MVQRLQTIAGAGLAYAESPNDRDRYRLLAELASEIVAAEATLTSGVTEKVLVDDGYPTPKVDVRAVVFSDDGQLLLVREASDGLWSLPGGWADLGDTPGEVAVREVAEETGYEVEAQRLLALWDKARHDHPRSLQSVYKVVIDCRLVGPEPTAEPCHEVLEVGWFSPSSLPPLSRGRITEIQIGRIVQLRADRNLPADFD